MTTAPRAIHLLYVPTLCCNLHCSYCYLGKQTTEAALKQDAGRAVATLQHTLDKLAAAGVLAFNVSLHGGEATTLPKPVLAELFALIRRHYLHHFDQLNALGYKKSNPHIKTNLYKFASLYDVFVEHKVSISASIDLPLSMHAKHRVTRSGKDWLQRTQDNLRLLAGYPYQKKISATLCADHLQDMQALIDDIWFIHRELGFDMNAFNIMFAFDSELSRQDHGHMQYASAEQQLQLYQRLKTEFSGTELEEGLLRNWFDEFKPNYCTNAFNCGEKFYLLQSDGNVYSCVRGQGIEEFHYGNVFEQEIEDILASGARKIQAIHQQFGFDSQCQGCSHLGSCHTGCAVVKFQQQSGRSYSCELQRQIYADHPHSYPADALPQAAAYAQAMHPAIAPTIQQPLAAAQFILPNDFSESKNSLSAMIDADPVLQQLYSEQAFVLEWNDEQLPLHSQLLKSQRMLYTFSASDSIKLHLRRELMQAACPEWLRNTLYLQLLRDSAVVYGDEQRTKQEHIFSFQLYANCLQPSERYAEDWLQYDLQPLLQLHQAYYQRGVLNNLFVTSLFLREYHYTKHKNNAFYHIQTANLPFQNIEFYYLSRG